MSRRAIQNMNTLYPDATAEELQAGDNVCIICREDMLANCKKLPCNHIFHTSCLRSWFQRQQTCPTCRMDVLRMTRAEAATPRPQQPPPQQQQPQAAAQQPQIPQMPQNCKISSVFMESCAPALRIPGWHIALGAYSDLIIWVQGQNLRKVWYPTQISRIFKSDIRDINI